MSSVEVDTGLGRLGHPGDLGHVLEEILILPQVGKNATDQNPVLQLLPA